MKTSNQTLTKWRCYFCTLAALIQVYHICRDLIIFPGIPLIGLNFQGAKLFSMFPNMVFHSGGASESSITRERRSWNNFQRTDADRTFFHAGITARMHAILLQKYSPSNCLPSGWNIPFLRWFLAPLRRSAYPSLSYAGKVFAREIREDRPEHRPHLYMRRHQQVPPAQVEYIPGPKFWSTVVSAGASSGCIAYNTSCWMDFIFRIRPSGKRA